MITNQKECGCYDDFHQLGHNSVIYVRYCEKHQNEQNCIHEKEKQKQRKYATTEIKCEDCNTHICWCNDSDLNCSYFYCDNCIISNNKD